jgi:FkbM family methyltransferase
MIGSTRLVLKQITPPILVPLGRAMLGWLRNRPTTAAGAADRVIALKHQFDQRNTDADDNEIVVRDGLSLKIHPASRDAFEHFCHLAPEMVEEMDCFISLTSAKKTLLDVGALHGLFSLVFALTSPNKRAVAVDPSPIAFARLLYNIHKNGLGNVTAVECALSDAAGTLRMHYEWEHAVAAGNDPGEGKHLAVTKRTGDDLCAELALAPDVIKIDVEGHEVKVIKGLMQTLRQHRPLVFLELHPRRIKQERDRLDELFATFDTIGYTASRIGGRGVSAAEVSRLTDELRLVFMPPAQPEGYDGQD